MGAGLALFAGALTAAAPAAPAAEGTEPAPEAESGASEDENPEEAVVIEASRPRRAATERVLDRAAVEAKPARSTDDLLRAMPGLHPSAHGGRGKAYQYFLRGFDAVHGADLAVDLEDVPLNELSNVHAHGYLDLHFIPTALVRSVELHPGPWEPEAGDFAVAGSASFALGLDEPGGAVRLGGGTDRSGEAAATWRPAAAPGGTFLVADLDLGRGVGMSRDWRQARAGAGVQGTLGAAEVRAWVLAGDGVFASPGVLREDDLAAGEVGFYDAYPGSGGGHSSRVLGAASLWGGDARRAGRVTAWAGYRALSLQQNFTGWAYDEVHGDGTLQRHRAGTFGLVSRGGWSPSPRWAVRGGLQARLDRLDQSEAGVDAAGAVWEERAALSAAQSDLGAWLAVPMALTRWLAVESALRGELFFAQVVGADLAWAPAVAPKLAVRLFPEARVTGFLHYGRGYRSPDARAAGDGGRAPVGLADSFEAGAVASPTAWLGLRAAGFATWVTDEIIFDHVAARYVATGSTRRLGVDAGATVRPVPPLRMEVDLTAVDGVYVATGDPIAYAPRLLVVGGVYAERLSRGSVVLTGGLRGVGLAPRPLPGGFFSHPVVTADLTTTVARGPWGLSLEVDNLLGNPWRDGEFVFVSRWDLDEPAAELPVRHFTAGTPTAARLALTRRF